MRHTTGTSSEVALAPARPGLHRGMRMCRLDAQRGRRDTAVLRESAVRSLSYLYCGRLRATSKTALSSIHAWDLRHWLHSSRSPANRSSCTRGRHVSVLAAAA